MHVFGAYVRRIILYNAEKWNANTFRFKLDLHSPTSKMQDSFKINLMAGNGMKIKTVNRNVSMHSPLGAKILINTHLRVTK